MAFLFIITALPCEAAPLIKHFSLKAAPSIKAFPLYQSDSIALVISGIGKVNAASATAFLYAYKGMPPYASWLNIGIAGHQTMTVGSCSIAHKVRDKTREKSWYPSLVMDLPSPTTEVITVDQPDFTYLENCGYEMEASGFFETASRFSTFELIHSMKIISDNPKTPLEGFDKNFVTSLIEKNLSQIDSFAQTLLTMSQKINMLNQPSKDLDWFTSRWHFTSTQKIQLQKLLRQWEKGETRASIKKDIRKELPTKQLLSLLKEKVNALPIRLK